MTTKSDRYRVYSLDKYRDQCPSAIPAASYDSFERAVMHTETVTYPMGVIDSCFESRGFVYVSNVVEAKQ